MNALAQHWNRLLGRYAALSRREKLLLAAVIVLVPLFAGETLILEPQRKRSLAKERSIAQQSASVTEMQNQIGALQQQLVVDPDAAAKAELAALQAEQQRLEEQLHELSSTLVPPEAMNGLLERLLSGHAGLRLLSLKTLPPQSVLAPPAAAGDPAKAAPAPGGQRFDLYRHGVELRLEGSFAELQAYLVQLEQSPQRLLWGQLQYSVGEYPKAEMTLMVYTLSADVSWLAL